MQEFKTPEIDEIKKPEPENFKDIQPEKGMTTEKAKKFWNNVFDKRKDLVESVKEFGSHFNTLEHMIDHTPTMDSEKGHWEGERGYSKFIPNENTEAGMKAKEKLAEYGEDGIIYKKGEPDFSKCSETTVTIDNMTENRDDYLNTVTGEMMLGNFSQASIACAKEWNDIARDGRTDWTARDVDNWRRENNCTWHERCDMKTMDLISRDIHNTRDPVFLHSGGCSECKKRDTQNSFDLGGKFDE